MKAEKMGVYTLVAHFALTIVFIFAYLFTLYKGIPDDTFKNMVMLVGGWWFGALSSTAFSSKKKDNGKDKGKGGDDGQ